ncbi:tRNA (adenosine(37)-N6)-threonylcarbamoyltransferase complex ATPase subunit type 1 TsaE [Bartonella sp. LJL80]
MNFSFFLEDEAATKRFAQDFALALKAGDLVTLEGDLGAGKSTLARAIIHTLADDEGMDVPSPTFTLVQIYELARFCVAHADLYRLSEAQEIDELGFDDARETGVLLVEWPQKADGGLGTPDFAITLTHEGRGRRIDIIAGESSGKRLQRSLTIRDFLQKNGRGDCVRRFFTGDASARSYELIYCDNGHEVLMDAPEMEMPETTGPSYAEIAHLGTDITQFIGTDRLIVAHGFVAPHIAAQDIHNGLLITDDLGRDGILDGDRRPIPERYIAAAQLLAAFHQKDWPHEQVFDDFVLKIPRYDRSVLQAEVSLLLDWYLPYVGSQNVDAALRDAFFDAWEPFFAAFEAAESTFVMRDYHSPNIIWRANETGFDRLGLIDFQDGQIGPTAYDLVSLAQDARVPISRELETQIVDAYCVARREARRPFDEVEFRKAYAIAGAQRISKILGIFVRLDRRDGKPAYLKYLPHCQDYLIRNLAHTALVDLKAFYLKAGFIHD